MIITLVFSIQYKYCMSTVHGNHGNFIPTAWIKIILSLFKYISSWIIQHVTSVMFFS